jgi:hypothetical protein
VARAVRQQAWDAIILASGRFQWGLDEAYRRVRTLDLRGRALYPKTGWKARPRFVYEPRPAGAPPDVETRTAEDDGPEGDEPAPP